MTGQTPNERPRLELSPQDWEKAVQWRPFIYKRLAKFGSRVTKRAVSWMGEIGTPEFRWAVSGGTVYGVDGASLMQDLEYRALEAAARAAHTFDKGRGVKFVTYLGKVIDNALYDEFTAWVQSSSATVHRPLEWAEDLPYEEEFDQEEQGSGLTPEQEEALHAATGALTSRELWALRMDADGVPEPVIRERLGLNHRQSTHALLKRAKEKGAAAFERAFEEDAQ